MKLSLLCLVTFAFSMGCVSISPRDFDGGAEVTESVSKFDGTVEIKMGVAHLQELKLKIGAYKTSKMKKSDLVLIAEVPGAENIESKDGLQISIDGKIYKLSSIDTVTDIHTGSLSSKRGESYGNYSSKRFSANKDLIDKILNAKVVVFRILYIDGKYTEDVMAKPKNWMGGDEWTVKFGLTEFRKKAFP